MNSPGTKTGSREGGRDYNSVCVREGGRGREGVVDGGHLIEDCGRGKCVCGDGWIVKGRMGRTNG